MRPGMLRRGRARALFAETPWAAYGKGHTPMEKGPGAACCVRPGPSYYEAPFPSS